jgi:arginine/ornithine N-succinyltransferase beta subunit
MIVIIDTKSGKTYNFKTRKSAGTFIGVSQPTLREWLKNPFYLYRVLIITETDKRKLQAGERELAERALLVQKQFV